VTSATYERGGASRSRRFPGRGHQNPRWIPARAVQRRICLVEERHVFLDVNMERLRVAAQDIRDADVDTFADHALSMFGAREDDVALIALRRARLPSAEQTFD
jgi:hypothetical protein